MPYTHTHAHTQNTRVCSLGIHALNYTETLGGGFYGYLFIHLFPSLLRHNCSRNLEEVFSLSLKQPGFTFLGFKEDYIQGCSITLNRCDIPGWWVFKPVNSCELAFQNPSMNFFSMRIQHLAEKQRLSANQGENPLC